MWNSTDERLRRVVWRCNRKYEVKEKKSCENRHIDALIRYKANQFIEIIKEAEVLKEFNIDIYFKIIKKMIVFEGNKIIVTLLDGIEIECEIE